ncbi:FISUMP domain-containing protein [Ekhidna sp. MALMAid0563]|uniref:FISUMP domain-containing protein n=1 Tax=Ekhidna sp. MALMAid0563 TaxID=3143937 RepID=UPI0032DFCE50
MKYLIPILMIFVIQQDKITDYRDQQEYSLKTIGDKTWIKENLRFLEVNPGKFILSHEKYGVYYKNGELENVCPDGYHIPSLSEWKSLIEQLPGKRNSRQGKLVPMTSLNDNELLLGGMGRQDTVLLSQVMGYYWTSTDTLKTFYKEPDNGLQKHLIGIHIWSSGEQDSINVEPTYMLAETYASMIKMNCKCIKD